MTGVREACAARRDDSARYRQILFSFYNHPRPNFTGHPSDSVLHQRMVSHRIEVCSQSSTLQMLCVPPDSYLKGLLAATNVSPAQSPVH